MRLFWSCLSFISPSLYFVSYFSFFYHCHLCVFFPLSSLVLSSLKSSLLTPSSLSLKVLADFYLFPSLPSPLMIIPPFTFYCFTLLFFSSLVSSNNFSNPSFLLYISSPLLFLLFLYPFFPLPLSSGSLTFLLSFIFLFLFLHLLLIHSSPPINFSIFFLFLNPCFPLHFSLGSLTFLLPFIFLFLFLHFLIYPHTHSSLPPPPLHRSLNFSFLYSFSSEQVYFCIHFPPSFTWWFCTLFSSLSRLALLPSPSAENYYWLIDLFAERFYSISGGRLQRGEADPSS